MASMQAMSTVPRAFPVTLAEWEAMEDPPGGKYEILNGRLVVSPSPDAEHNRYCEDLADLLRAAIDRANVDYDVTIDVEWRVVDERTLVKQAPRGDVVIGRLDDTSFLHRQRPDMVIEIWDRAARPRVRLRRRNYWKGQGLQHYWEVLLGDETRVEVYDLQAAEFPVQSARGADPVSVDSPFPLVVIPDEVQGWAHAQWRVAETARAEARRADTEAERADTEAERADTEAERANAEARRASIAIERLRAAGLPVDDLVDPAPTD